MEAIKNSKRVFLDFIQRITLPETTDEIRSMAWLVFENLFGLSRAAIYTETPLAITTEQEKQLQDVIERINKAEPLQYILGEADFFGRTFNVNLAVLIPRPETEELVRYILELYRTKEQPHPFTILDIGTGSGCIPITLALEMPTSHILATDVSQEALEVATENAKRLAARVTFLKHNILQDPIPVSHLDVVVSNPPYITRQEAYAMKKNVVAYEPHLALFVADEDPLIFYRAIANKAKQVLKANGLLVVEINERFGNEVAALFTSTGYSQVMILNDMQGKARIVTGQLIL